MTEKQPTIHYLLHIASISTVKAADMKTVAMAYDQQPCSKTNLVDYIHDRTLLYIQTHIHMHAR